MDQILPLIIMLAVGILATAGMWVLYTKANGAGWAAIVPIYNIIVLLKIAGKPVWWIVLFFIPVVSIVAMILIYISFAKSYGKSAGYGIGMILLPFVFVPMLAFGDAKYQGPAG